ncbi:MAG TPA: hypothetical protein DD409_06810 [Bacteroidales bacterium]|nr:hypothetical protein [Bacteroidales bacterium]
MHQGHLIHLAGRSYILYAEPSVQSAALPGGLRINGLAVLIVPRYSELQIFLVGIALIFQGHSVPGQGYVGFVHLRAILQLNLNGLADIVKR